MNIVFFFAVSLQGCTWCKDCLTLSDVDDCPDLEDVAHLEKLVYHILVATPIIESELIRYCRKLILVPQEEGIRDLTFLVKELMVRGHVRSPRIVSLIEEPVQRFKNRRKAFWKRFQDIGAIIYRRCIHLISGE